MFSTSVKGPEDGKLSLSVCPGVGNRTSGKIPQGFAHVSLWGTFQTKMQTNEVKWIKLIKVRH